MSFRPGKGWLSNREIPLSAGGDPNFGTMEELKKVFSEAELVYLVNKQLYALNYQRETHRKRAAEERELLAPVKAKLKELFGVAWIKATEEQQRGALKAVQEDRARAGGVKE